MHHDITPSALFTLLRRFSVLAALMFWQGGFTFYAAVVVPIGSEVLGSDRAQGMITRQVSKFLNLTTAVALMPLAWDAFASGDRNKYRRWLRWLAWSMMLLGLVALLPLHGYLDQLIDPEKSWLLDRRAFRTGHRWYLWISTVQWGAAIVYALLMLIAWTEEERTRWTAPAPSSTVLPD